MLGHGEKSSIVPEKLHPEMKKGEDVVKLDYLLTDTARTMMRQPYIVGPPLHESESFYGPYRVLSACVTALKTHQRAVLIGSERTGKTTMMLQACRKLRCAPLWHGPWDSIAALRENIASAEGSNTAILLDEITLLLSHLEWSELVVFLNRQIDEERVGAVLATSIVENPKIEELFPRQTWLKMTPLTDQEAENYIRQTQNPHSDGQMFHPKLVREFVEAAQGHPFVLSTLCCEAWFLAREPRYLQGRSDVDDDFLKKLRWHVLDKHETKLPEQAWKKVRTL